MTYLEINDFCHRHGYDLEAVMEIHENIDGIIVANKQILIPEHTVLHDVPRVGSDMSNKQVRELVDCLINIRYNIQNRLDIAIAVMEESKLLNLSVSSALNEGVVDGLLKAAYEFNYSIENDFTFTHSLERIESDLLTKLEEQ